MQNSSNWISKHVALHSSIKCNQRFRPLSQHTPQTPLYSWQSWLVMVFGSADDVGSSKLMENNMLAPGFTTRKHSFIIAWTSSAWSIAFTEKSTSSSDVWSGIFCSVDLMYFSLWLSTPSRRYYSAKTSIQYLSFTLSIHSMLPGSRSQNVQRWDCREKTGDFPEIDSIRPLWWKFAKTPSDLRRSLQYFNSYVYFIPFIRSNHFLKLIDGSQK